MFKSLLCSFWVYFIIYTWHILRLRRSHCIKMPMIPGFVCVLLTGLILYNASYKSDKDISSAESGDIDPLVNDHLSVDTEDIFTTSSNYGDETVISHQEVIPTTSLSSRYLVPYFYRYVSYFNKTYSGVDEYRKRFENFYKSLRRLSGKGLHELIKSILPL